jgi:hypothetical protein
MRGSSFTPQPDTPTPTVEAVNTAQHRTQVRDFLISRRERITLEHSQA